MSGSGRPFFSIVVPTRNRGRLLEQALAGVLGQTETDFELIVSDNWSTDETAAVIAGAGQKRALTAIRPPKPLPMADHWNFAVAHATGRWILLLGDDDYFSKDLLATVRPVVETSDTTVVTWHSAVYHHNIDMPQGDIKNVPFYYDPSRINKLDIMSWTGRTYPIDAREQLTKLYGFQDIIAPSGHVSALRNDLIEQVVGWAGALFHPPYPDFGCSAAVLATARTMTFIDVPLHVLGRVPRLGALSYLLSPEKQSEFNAAMAAEYGRDDLYDDQPLQSSTLIATNIAASLGVVRRLMPPAAAEAASFDWERYFMRCRLEITAMQRAGFPMDELARQYERALATQPTELQAAVRSNLAVRFPRAGDAVSRLKASPPAHLARKLLYNRRPSGESLGGRADVARWRATIDGADAGFSNIGETSDYVDRLRRDGTMVTVDAR